MELGRVVVVLAVLGGCSGNGAPPPPDGGKRDGRPAGDLAPASSILQLVVNSISLPQSAAEHAVDLDGNGTPDNQLGAIIATMKALPLENFDFQTNITRTLTEGSFILLLDLVGRSLVDDSGAQLWGYVGQDLDVPPNPADNFSGSETLVVKPGSPQDLHLDGAIVKGQLTGGPGTLVAPLPAIAGTTPEVVSLRQAQVRAELSASGIKSGRINGGVPWQEVDQKFIPMIATEATKTLKDPSVPKNVKDALVLAFDANKDGAISANEIRQSALLALVLKPDVDLDGDKTLDALSVGMAFTAVPCVIKR